MTVNLENTADDTSNMPVIDLPLLNVTTPEILTPEGVSLPASHRCDFCGVQAWVEVEMAFTRTIQHLNTEAKIGSGEALHAAQEIAEKAKEVVLLCAHHYKKGEDKIKATAHRIVDYRPTLVAQEKMGGPAL